MFDDDETNQGNQGFEFSFSKPKPFCYVCSSNFWHRVNKEKKIVSIPFLFNSNSLKHTVQYSYYALLRTLCSLPIFYTFVILKYWHGIEKECETYKCMYLLSISVWSKHYLQNNATTERNRYTIEGAVHFQTEKQNWLFWLEWIGWTNSYYCFGSPAHNNYFVSINVDPKLNSQNMQLAKQVKKRT
jgi:hypothetical protein